ncbi:tetratricopeptide repeat protein [Halodesulfovibrio sp.]|uniref:tetratricopeptide repeat protein n=1 Tax=Halodesulfovibrio sp. TaxID=1912772 RepID=UPI0025BD9E34|nr:tetratricopeptide repeat protein [Halodesulfovibrio sp.]
MNSTDKESLLLLAHLYLQHGKEPDARVLLEAVQELFPEDSYACRALAWIYLKQGNIADALEQLDLWERHEPAPTDEERRIVKLLRNSAMSQSCKPSEIRSVMESHMKTAKSNASYTSQYDTGA